jgi:hypothetical protein
MLPGLALQHSGNSQIMAFWLGFSGFRLHFWSLSRKNRVLQCDNCSLLVKTSKRVLIRDAVASP